jgi:hypothetical protein
MFIFESQRTGTDDRQLTSRQVARTLDAIKLECMKSILILKASRSICGSEVGLIKNHCQLLNMDVREEDVLDDNSFQAIIDKYDQLQIKFDYIYLCTHGNNEGFETDLSGTSKIIYWTEFSQLMCEDSILKPNTILLLACCKGGLLKVATDILAVCNKINFICGVKWNVHAWDLTTGFIVFIHNVEIKNAEPNYAAEKASLATDYTFTCYDRDEIEMQPSYQLRQKEIFNEFGWVDSDGNWIETDPVINDNTGH